MIDYLSHRSKQFIFVCASALVMVIGAIDYITGPEIAFAVFYLVPVSLAAWRLNRHWTGFIVVSSALVWLAADVKAGVVYSHWLIPYWNSLTRFGIFTIVAVLIFKARHAFDLERQNALLDPLTQIANRRAFLLALSDAAQRSASEHLTLAYLDVDYFKSINDQSGHAAGDAVLVATARALTGAVRLSDTVARLGGDEFALVLNNTPYTTAELILSRVREELDLTARREHVSPVTYSIGAVTFVQPVCTVTDMLHLVDAAMYEVKHSGRNGLKHVLYDAHARLSPLLEEPSA